MPSRGDGWSLSSEQAAEFARLESQQRRVQGEIVRFRAGDRLGREELHGRAVR